MNKFAKKEVATLYDSIHGIKYKYEGQVSEQSKIIAQLERLSNAYVDRFKKNEQLRKRIAELEAEEMAEVNEAFVGMKPESVDRGPIIRPLAASN